MNRRLALNVFKIDKETFGLVITKNKITKPSVFYINYPNM